MRIEGSRVLVTGGTGSIGSEIVRQLLKRSPAHIVVFSRDDSKHFYFQQELANFENITFIIGNVRDREALARAFVGGIDIVIHAAALKHVLICEQNPTEAVKTNILGTQNVVDMAKEKKVKVMMMISTDKAVAPTSTMGATKYVAEKLTIDGNLTGSTKCACVRFGNVLGSRGSVIPAMIKGIRERGEIWISDDRVTRFAMPIPDAATLVLDAAQLCEGGEIFVLKMKSFSLQQLVRVMKTMPFATSGFGVEQRGLIRAEKLHEDLITTDEIGRLWESDSHYIVAPPVGSWKPTSVMTKVELEDYNSSGGLEFSDEELAQHIQECVVALGLD
ncbi:MAG TPA: SDR family NAD(P)-dependent oxidoreductase [Candidatus Thalassarchaeaceae archaeon]|nr:MAG TPA: SDR family NAD(P)-dependent oxidoreductase [Candidatus Poseidoniales archaeon]HIH82914.1 SDR family NAD(P)-dependent oxidoreductase [Candidatus Thalassarchaeaceae archaeon]